MRRRLIPYAAALWQHFGLRLLDVPQCTAEEIAAMTRAIDEHRMTAEAQRAQRLYAKG